MLLVRKVIHELAGVTKEGRLEFLISAFLGAYNRRTDVVAKLSGDVDSEKLDAIIEMLRAQSGQSDLLIAINNLDRKVDNMSSNIDRIEKEAADAAENVQMVRTALETLNTTVSELKTTVADLQVQVEKGQLDQARLDAAASALEKADDDLDSLVLPPTDGDGNEGGDEG